MPTPTFNPTMFKRMLPKIMEQIVLTICEHMLPGLEHEHSLDVITPEIRMSFQQPDGYQFMLTVTLTSDHDLDDEQPDDSMQIPPAGHA